MNIDEIINDMEDTLSLACSEGFSEYIDRHTVQNWIDKLKSRTPIVQQSLSGSQGSPKSCATCLHNCYGGSSELCLNNNYSKWVKRT